MTRSIVLALLALCATAHAADPRAKAVSQIKYMEKANSLAESGKLTPHASLVKVGGVGAGSFMDSHGRQATVVVRGNKMTAISGTHESKLLKALHEGRAAASEMKDAVEREDYNRRLDRRGGMYSIMAHTDRYHDGGYSQLERAQVKLDKAVAKVKAERARQRPQRSTSVNVGEWQP